MLENFKPEIAIIMRSDETIKDFNLKRVTIKVSYHEEYNSIRKFFKKFEELIKMSLKYNNVVPKIEFVITEETEEKDIETVYSLYIYLIRIIQLISIYLLNKEDY